MMRVEDYDINPALIVIDMQNGFVSKGGYESSIEHVKEYYGLVMSINEFSNQFTQRQTIVGQTEDHR